VKILYLNHTGLVSGAERSLLTLVEGLPREVEPLVACPAGPLAAASRALGVPVTEIPGTDASLSLHPLHTSRGVADLVRSALAVRATVRSSKPDLAHANTIRAGLVASAVERIGGPPVVAHVRDRLPPGLIADATLKALVTGPRLVIANSRYSAARIPVGRAEVRVIPNPVDLKRFSRSSADRAAARSRLCIEPTDTVLAVIGQITPWKGQDLAIRVAAGLAPAQPGLRLLIVGSAKFTSRAARFDSRAYEAELHRTVTKLGLDGRVLFLGEREDVPAILAAADLVLVPSWEEPFGRVVIEAMAIGVPVIATAVGGPSEIIDDGVDGLLLPPRRPEPWVAATRSLLAQPERLRDLGRRGHETAAARFGVERHVEAVLEAYEAVLQPASL
jgi:glycosyltransferase involved in cell wall biosynthesis